LRRWRNPFWAYAFIACFILYLIGVGYLIQDVVRNNKHVMDELKDGMAGMGNEKGAEKGKRGVGDEKGEKGEKGGDGEDGGFDMDELAKGPPKDLYVYCAIEQRIQRGRRLEWDGLC
jgi:hypothetical protein